MLLIGHAAFAPASGIYGLAKLANFGKLSTLLGEGVRTTGPETWQMMGCSSCLSPHVHARPFTPRFATLSWTSHGTLVNKTLICR